jgi:hypothetical protein
LIALSGACLKLYYWIPSSLSTLKILACVSHSQGDFDAFLSKVDGLGYERILLLFQLPFSFVFRADRRNVMRDQSKACTPIMSTSPPLIVTLKSDGMPIQCMVVFT